MNTKPTTKKNSLSPEDKIKERIRHNNTRFLDYSPVLGEQDHSYHPPFEVRGHDPFPTLNFGRQGW